MNTFQDLVSMRLAVEDKSEDTSLTEFNCFSELPQELRLMIWNFTVPVSRLVEERFCRQPLNPFSCPLNSIPYSSMPDSFRVCFESKEEITRHYTQAKYGGDRGQACDDLSIHCAPSVPFNPDKDTLGFDSLFTISTDYWALVNFLQGGQLPLGIPDWRNEQFPSCQPWIIKPWTVKRVQIKPSSLFLPAYLERRYGYQEDNFAGWDRVFVGFVFQDLDEFILQDFDCKLTEKHHFYSLEDQEVWKKRILLMLQVETTHDEYSYMRAGSQFKIPTVEIRRGAKVEGVICQNCRELSQDRKTMRKFKKWRAKEDAMRQPWVLGQSSYGTNGTIFEEW